MTVLAVLVCVCALLPCLVFCWNLPLYGEPPAAGESRAVSVLIPARNEESSIAAAVESVLASRGITFELIVMDDSSTDGTAQIVSSTANQDSRVRLAAAPALPDGWNGKQHACHSLAALARFDVLCFLDADVRIAPDALSRMAAFLDQSHSDLVSGFPHQVTVTFLEWLLLPLIHFILLGYLPLAASRARPRQPGLAAGCGQFLMVRRNAYICSGGHAAIRATMHDGLLLPQLFRRCGFRTALADLTSLAECRMYHSASEVWNGLAKNATEGMAAPARILPFTIFLLFGQVLPLVFTALAFFTAGFAAFRSLFLVALIASYLPRIVAVARFRQPLRSAILHPLGILILLALQWYALFRKLARSPIVWRSRAY